jgi:hypothetical protein
MMMNYAYDSRTIFHLAGICLWFSSSMSSCRENDHEWWLLSFKHLKKIKTIAKRKGNDSWLSSFFYFKKMINIKE